MDNKKRTYFKYGFIAFAILFILFVVIRKISSDNESVEIAQKSERVIEQKTTLNEKQNPLKNEETSSLNKKNLDTRLALDKKAEVKKDQKELQPISKSQIEKEVTIVSLKEAEPIKKKVSLPVKKNMSIEKKLINKEYNYSNIHDIDDLKVLKKDMRIAKNEFFIQKRRHVLGDQIGVYEVIAIYPNFIRFKNHNDVFYNLRFY